MFSEWFIIALLSAATFAVVNILDDNLLRNVYRTPFFGAIISGFFGMLPILGIIFFPVSLPPLFVILLAILSGFFTIVYYFYYFKALGIEAPSVVIALFSFSPALIPFIAYFVLGESLSMSQYIGFALIIGASVLLSAVDIKKFKLSKAFYMILFASLIYAVIAIMQKIVYTAVDFWSGYVFFALGLGLGALFLSTAFKEGRRFYSELGRLKKWIGIFFLVEIVGITAELLSNFAISKGPVSLVKVVEGTQPMFVLLFAVLLYPLLPRFFREATEGEKTKKFILMGVMLVGLYFINSA